MTATKPVPPFAAACICLLFLMGATLPAGAQNAAASETETKAEAEAEATWRVISAEGAGALQRALPLERSLDRITDISSVSIQNDRVYVCAMRHAEPPARFCGWLFHPEQGYPGDRRAGPFVLHADNDVIAEIIPTLKTIDARVWNDVKTENTPYPLLSSGWMRALMDLLDLDRADSARALLSGVSALDAPERSLMLARALLAVQRADADRAATLLDELDEELSNDPGVDLVYARADILNGDVARGVTRMAEATQVLPAGAPGRCESSARLLRLLESRGAKERMRSAATAMLEAFADCVSLPLFYASYLFNAGDYARTMQVLDKAMTRHKQQPDLMLLKARLLRRMGNAHEALGLLDAIDRLLPNNDDVITLHSTIASSLPPDEKRAYRDRMLARYTESLKHDKIDLFAGHAAGVMSYYLGDYETVIPIMDRLRERMPQNQRVYIYGGMSRYETGDSQGAQRWIDELQRQGASDPDIHYCQAVLSSTNDPQQAALHLQKYLASPPTPDSHLPKRELAETYLSMLENGKVPEPWRPGHGNFDLPRSKGDGDRDAPAASGSGSPAAAPLATLENEPKGHAPAYVWATLALFLGLILGYLLTRRRGGK